MFWKRPRKTVDFFAEKQFLLPKTGFRAGENRFLLHTAVRKEERANAGLGAERNGIGLDALDHGEQSVGTRRRKVFGQTDLRNKIEVGIANFLGGVAVDHAQQETNEAFDDKGVALSAESERAVGVLIANNPNAALAAVDEIGLVFLAGGQYVALFAEVDDELVAIHPIFDFRKFFDDLVLYFVDGHI